MHEVCTSSSAQPEAEQDPEQKKLWKKEWPALQVSTSLVVDSKGLHMSHPLDDFCEFLLPSHFHPEF